MNRVILAVVALASTAALPAIATTAQPAAATTATRCHTTAPSDFNGDGRSDLAVSAPGAKDVDTSDAFNNTSGDVTVFAGGLKGLNYAQTLYRKRADSYPEFGTATAAGDFNGDGCADLVVMDNGGGSGGVDYPGGAVKRGYGAASIYYGHPDSTKTDLFGRQQTVPAHTVNAITKMCTSSTGCPLALGATLAAGDVNGNGYDDLILVASTTDAADNCELVVIPGSATGLRPGRSRTLVAGHDEVLPATKPSSQIDNVSVGDVNGDGYADVAVGFGTGSDFPGIDVLYGSARGLDNGHAPQWWARSRPGVPGRDRHGAPLSIALGDFRGNGRDDLAFAEGGSPKVTVVYGTTKGLSTRNVQTWSKSSPGVTGNTTHQDHWGSTLVAGRFGTARYDDLVIGDSATEQISVLQGNHARGLIAKGNLLWDQDTDGIPGQHEIGNGWSDAMAVGYFGHGLGEDLAIGAPFANGTRGTVTVLYGSKTPGIGLRSALAQPLLKPSVNGTPGQPHDDFGAALQNS